MVVSIVYFLFQKEGLEQMLQVVSIFIAQFVPIGDRVALVEFDSVAQKLTNLCTIKDETSREDLLNNLPTTAGGNTCIGCGLDKSLKVKKISIHQIM